MAGKVSQAFRASLRFPQILVWLLWVAFPLYGVVASNLLLPPDDGYTRQRRHGIAHRESLGRGALGLHGVQSPWRDSHDLCAARPLRWRGAAAPGLAVRDPVVRRWRLWHPLLRGAAALGSRRRGGQVAAPAATGLAGRTGDPADRLAPARDRRRWRIRSVLRRSVADQAPGPHHDPRSGATAPRAAVSGHG